MPVAAATADQVQKARFYHRSHRRGHGTMERFYGEIWQRLPDKNQPDQKPVSEHIPAEELDEILRRVRHEETGRMLGPNGQPELPSEAGA